MLFNAKSDRSSGSVCKCEKESDAEDYQNDSRAMRILLSHPKANKVGSADYQCDQYWHRDHDREACSVLVKSQQALTVAGGLEGAGCANECVCHGANKLSYVAAK